MIATKSEMNNEFKVETARQTDHVMPNLHYHDFYEIYIQDEGTRDHIIGNSFYELHPHEVLLFKPNLLHQSFSKNPHTRTIIYFTDHYLHKYFSDEIIKRFQYIFHYKYVSLSPESYYRIREIVRDLSKEDYYDRDNLIFTKLSEILMILWKHTREIPDTQIPYPIPQNNSVSPLITYVHENYLTLNNITEIADSFYITPSHLCRTFKKLTGYTIIQYINLLKIHHATFLLRESDKNITEIALDCGFNSTMYFCKTFKSILNITPTEYRKL